MFKRLGLLLIFGLFVSQAVYSTHAQDDHDLPIEQLVLVEYVAAIYANLAELTSYQVSGEITGLQIMQVSSPVNETVTQNVEITFVSKVVPRSTGWDDIYNVTDQSQSHITSEIENNLIFNLELLLVDQTLYARANSHPPEFGTTLPEGWFNWEQEIGATAIGDVAQDKVYSEPFLFYYLVDETTVSSIRELDSQVLDQREMRVFTITLDSEALIEAGVISPTGIGENTIIRKM